ncbi:MAG: hypothetical protein N3F10_07940, partial [Candidatus Bathyarchaeota archaeon]|nr:hypothetical protein [Candidatus Bathyarchaeota archaeon]
DVMIEILTEILKWIKVTSIPQVKKLLLELLPSDEEKLAYQYSDGRTSQEVSQLASVSYITITRWWKNWIRAGVAEPISVKGGERAKRIFSLDEFGIEIPLPKGVGVEKKIEATKEEHEEGKV